MRTRTRHTSALATGAVVSGLLAYLFFALVTRALGVRGAAPVSVLWAWWAFAGAALTFPVQHWIARLGGRPTAARAGSGARCRGWLAVSGALAAGGRCRVAGPRSALFGAGRPWFPLLVGPSASGRRVIGVVRGMLTRREPVRGRRRRPGRRERAALPRRGRAGRGRRRRPGGVRARAGGRLPRRPGWPSAFRLARTDGTPSGTRHPSPSSAGAAGGQLLGAGGAHRRPGACWRWPGERRPR